ncbi:MAG: helix-turn-helix domain-containing protein [Magnetospirillum sp. WYHS-4]
MIWAAVARVGTVLSVVAAGLQLYDIHTREIKPHRIYTSKEAARFLGMARRAVLDLVKNGTLRAKMVDGNYRISGQSLLDYLNQ